VVVFGNILFAALGMATVKPGGDGHGWGLVEYVLQHLSERRSIKRPNNGSRQTLASSQKENELARNMSWNEF